MTVKLPKTLKIGPFLYNVVEKTNDELGTLLGRYNCTEQTIWIKDEQNDQCRIDTLLHECLHALCFHSGNPGITREIEEQFVSSITPWLIMFIKDNPSMVNLIRKM